ncbi:MAG TPA: amidohydrolase family protein [Thermoleophilaceae bacterium]|nr:amidohydrolase family protein [Thermoleophilaceae bacterium]
MDSIDVHQHLWPESILRGLERRSCRPRAVWLHDRWEIRPAGERSFEVDLREHDPDRRGPILNAFGLDRAVVALSSPVGIEALPAEEALDLLSAWSAAAAELPSELDWWAWVPSELEAEAQATVAREGFGRGATGLCLPAGRLSSPSAARAALPVLSACDEARLPVFVHPGPVARASGEADWWPAATGYVAEQHAAWHAFHAAVRRELPGLRAIFALLAGLAPLHTERTVGRGGAEVDGAHADPLSFYDVSSYGPRAVRAAIDAVGIGQLVYGTDYPVAPLQDPVADAFGPERADLVRRDGARRALGHA